MVQRFHSLGGLVEAVHRASCFFVVEPYLHGYQGIQKEEPQKLATHVASVRGA